MSKDIVRLINKSTQNLLRSGPRGHLGASLIGKRCARQIWYSFRWAYQEDHTGRLLRLFDRGHKEEDRVIRWLRASGFEVQDYDKKLLYHDPSDSYILEEWDKEQEEGEEPLADVYDSPVHIERAKAQGIELRQWSFKDIGGHFAGSGDGKVRPPEDLAGDMGLSGLGLLEVKTANDKSFKTIKAKGVLSAKQEHYIQMQLYMHYFKLSWALYVCVNKNDDEIYVQIIHYREEIALQAVDKARGIVEADKAPPRITNDPSWWECKFCAFREICHYGQIPQKNCRSCVFSCPNEEGGWTCNKHYGTIPPSFVSEGCKQWEGFR